MLAGKDLDSWREFKYANMPTKGAIIDEVSADDPDIRGIIWQYRLNHDPDILQHYPDNVQKLIDMYNGIFDNYGWDDRIYILYATYGVDYKAELDYIEDHANSFEEGIEMFVEYMCQTNFNYFFKVEYENSSGVSSAGIPSADFYRNFVQYAYEYWSEY